VSNYPQYQVLEGQTLGPVQLPNETISSGTIFFVLESLINPPPASWGIPPSFAGTAKILNLQAVNNLADAPNFYIVGSPWTTTTAAQNAAQADYNTLIANRNGVITQQELQGPITSSSVVAILGTPYGPG
jgi:hypothetical protein